MSHGHAAGPGAEECRLSMLWNWNTVGACFLTPKWFIRTEGMMVASCVGVMLFAATMELCRRGGRELDKMLADRLTWSVLSSAGGPTDQRRVVTVRASAWQQLLRSVFHAITFGGTYIIMLLAMYFNGYMLISIFIGAGLGKFFTDWFVVSAVVGAGRDKVGNKDGGRGDGIQETAICCS